ncbi:MAG: (d)CMP kinase [Terrimicrobiaceae bacterium]
MIAIDGPAASGKSTVAKRLARRLGFAWVNSGAFYRAITWWLLKESSRGVDESSAREVLSRTELSAGFESDVARLLLDDMDPSAHLREPEVNANVSPVSQLDVVRAVLSSQFRALAATRDCVIEGRDIGSCVFPQTPHKFYIDASPEERLRRRAADGEADRIAERDRMDSQRAKAPLIAAADAIVIDTTHIGIEDVIELVLAHLKQHGLTPPQG